MAVPLWDQGNELLGEAPSQLTTGVIDTPAGQRLAMTVRTPSATVTVLLGGADAKTWAAQLSRDSAAMSSAGLVAAGGVLAGPGGG